ncbi:Kinetochore protein Spc24 [Elasticomyces elasticus]|nr:Kinetochore protein Spc24 [Elasticomyces elasticus]KAK3646307.1 Kinetochore protein Spc24 [Elasticomyces elasticus]KAK4916712.1 Kinetochore protein Spc24 [Elasticomyces elasticus]KAK5768027.1 Kinetochore protein Spc24 [Elasticomyces elasticus]
MPRPTKRAKLDAFSDNETEEAIAPAFTINADFAARFEHNKKREEKARLEEKYGSISLLSTKQQEEEEDEESTDESEDDDAELVDLEIDQEISATLEALRRKDPRIYDEGVKFYKDWEGVEGVVGGEGKKREEKPMFLHDYHRRNLLEGHAGGEEEEEEEEQGVETYQQEQDALKERLVGSMHDAVQPSSGSDNDDEDDFLVKKTKPKHSSLPAVSTTTGPAKRITESDIASASHDPETYLSNFMAARAWIAPTSSNSPYAALDEDDSEEDSRADKFEEAFNLRFEDPNKANEVLMSFQRDAGKNGVRRDEMTGRKKAREREKERKEAERLEREQERGRLRKLMVEEAEEKVRRIKEAAGLRGRDVDLAQWRDVDLAQWRDVIEGDFEGERWEEEMGRRFGVEYYDEAEGGSDGEEEGKRKVKKPKWEDDIDIKDLVPEFEDEEEGKQKPAFELSDDEEEEEDDAIGGVPIEEDGMDLDDETPAPITSSARTKNKDRKQDKLASKRAARSQRAALESLVDAQLPIAHPSIAPSLNPKKSTNITSKNTVSGFRYRQASPTFFGLTAKDVLFAEDAQLNEYVGLKKMHSFRDGEKKRRDKKRLSKKARLREWRRTVFGREEGPRQEYVGGEEAGEEDGEVGEEGRGGGAGRERVDGGASGGGKERGGEKVGKEGGVGEDGDVREGERRKKRKRSGKGKKSGANAVVVET